MCFNTFNIKIFLIFISVAVVIAFFCCWAPHHAQRLYAIYANDIQLSPAWVTAFYILTYVSGIFYFVSTCINPLLYNIMSYKFREAFKVSMIDILTLKHFHVLSSTDFQSHEIYLPKFKYSYDI